MHWGSSNQNLSLEEAHKILAFSFFSVDLKIDALPHKSRNRKGKFNYEIFLPTFRNLPGAIVAYYRLCFLCTCTQLLHISCTVSTNIYTSYQII